MYKISLSNKENVYFRRELFTETLKNINENKFVLINDEMINTAFIVSITKVTDWDSIPDKYLEKSKSVNLPVCKECGGKGFIVVEKNGEQVARKCSCQE